MPKIILVFLLLIIFGCNRSELKNNPESTNSKRAKSWYQKGLHQIQRDFSSSILYADSILYFSKNEAPEIEAMGQIVRGYYYTKNAEDVPAFKSFSRAETLLEKSKADTLKLKVLNGLGSNFLANGDFEKATEYFLLSLRIANRIKDNHQIANINSAFGDLYLQKGELKLAKKHLDKAMSLLENSKNNTLYLIASHNLANYMGMTGNIKKALELDEKGLEICDEINSTRLKVTFLDNKANCFYYTGQIDSAEVYFKECLRLDKLNNNVQLESDSYINLANIYIAKNNNAMVLKYIDTSLALAQKTNYQIGILKANQLLMDFYKKNKDYESATKAQENYIKTYKELTSIKKEKAIARYKAIYETDEKEIKLLQAKVKLGQKEKQIQSKNNIVQILGLLSIALLVLGYLVYRQLKLRNVQQKQEFELKTAIKEIESQNSLQNQRLRISRDLHDNIGAQLTFIISSVENLNYAFDIKNPQITNQLNKINDFAHSTILELRDTIWAMNSNEISNEDLKGRIHNFLEKAKNVKESIQFDFTISESLIDYSFSSLMGINIYRVLQEALNNAIKYSEANNIKVNISELKDLIQITISDDGKGFSLNDVQFGNGIANMKKRMTEIEGQFLLDSNETGTKITLTFTKTNQYA